MVSRCLLLLFLLLGSVGCWSAPRRAYYRPLGEPVSRDIQACDDEGPGWRFELRCQGSYLNDVEGAQVRTVHVQVDVSRTARNELRVPLADVRLDLLGGEQGPRTLELGEAWTGRDPVSGSLEVGSWSRLAADLFFDDTQTDEPPAEAVRVRWRHLADGEATWHDCTFALVPLDAPGGPVDRPPSDRAFAYRDGWYMPGLGTLGRRFLVDPEARRRHHVFHSP
jgi:hypothetical protein